MKIVIVITIAVFSGVFAYGQTLTRSFPWSHMPSDHRSYDELSANASDFYIAIAQSNWKHATRYIADGGTLRDGETFFSASVSGRGTVITPWNAVPIVVGDRPAFLLIIAYSDQPPTAGNTRFERVFLDLWVKTTNGWKVVPQDAISLSSTKVDFAAVDSLLLPSSEAAEKAARLLRQQEIQVEKETEISIQKELEQRRNGVN